jgi:hypothetical protein
MEKAIRSPSGAIAGPPMIRPPAAHQLETIGDGRSCGELAHERTVRVDWSPGDLTKKGLERRGLRFVPEGHLSREVSVLVARTPCHGRML